MKSSTLAEPSLSGSDGVLHPKGSEDSLKALKQRSDLGGLTLGQPLWLEECWTGPERFGG